MNLQLMTIRGIISCMPEEDQKKIKEQEIKLRKLMEEGGDAAKMALAIIGSEFGNEPQTKT